MAQADSKAIKESAQFEHEERIPDESPAPRDWHDSEQRINDGSSSPERRKYWHTSEGTPNEYHAYEESQKVSDYSPERKRDRENGETYLDHLNDSETAQD